MFGKYSDDLRSRVLKYEVEGDHKPRSVIIYVTELVTLSSCISIDSDSSDNRTTHGSPRATQ